MVHALSEATVAWAKVDTTGAPKTRPNCKDCSAMHLLPAMVDVLIPGHDNARSLVDQGSWVKVLRGEEACR